MNKKQLFIYADLNDLGSGEGFLPLRNLKVIDMLKQEYGEVTEGLKIWLFSPTYKNNTLDPTIIPGEIKKVKNTGELQIHVDEKDMEYLSESEKFKGYSIEEIMGKEWPESLKD